MKEELIIRACIMICTLMVLFATPFAYADRSQYSKEHQACIQREHSTASIINCISTEIKHQDRRLNRTYQDYFNSLSTTRRASELETLNTLNL